MLTVGRRFLGKRGDSTAHCSYCGVRWLRSQLVRNEAGMYACPDDQNGRDEVELSRLNAESAAAFAARKSPQGDNNAPYFKTDANEEALHRTTREDI